MASMMKQQGACRCRVDNLTAQRVAAGFSITRLAQLSNTTDLVIRRLEDIGTNGTGGSCSREVADRICHALGISRATAGVVEIAGEQPEQTWRSPRHS